MSDTKLRDLERRWKETGAVEDEAAYLVERVRVGDLTRERLELAAYCGHEAARKVRGRGACAHEEMEFEDWLGGLVARVSFALHVAVASGIRGFLDQRPRAYHATTLRMVLDAYDEWIKCPCPAHATGIGLALEQPTGERGPMSTLLHTAEWLAAFPAEGTASHGAELFDLLCRTGPGTNHETCFYWSRTGVLTWALGSAPTPQTDVSS